jgi:hypothetical protein
MQTHTDKAIRKIFGYKNYNVMSKSVIYAGEPVALG